jgi:DNA-binding PadR family transcriptional regulator
MVDPGLTELGRFAEPSLYILVSLSSGPRHGYAIMTDVEAISGLPMGPGTLYGALARLERRALIEALEPVDRRRPYRLTPLGSATLEAQLASLEGFVRTALARLAERS